MYVDRTSGVLASRPQLERVLLSTNRGGDQLVVTKLDRLGRSLEHLITLPRQLQERGVDLVVLDQGIDTSTALGRMFFQVLGSIAEFEHALMSERPHDGPGRGRAGGQKPKLGPRQVTLARAMYDEPDEDDKRHYTVAAIAAEFGVIRPTIYRHLNRSVPIPCPPARGARVGPSRAQSARRRPTSGRFRDLPSLRGEAELMALGSAIEWTEATWNPTTGCDRVSAGCDNCYALILSKRLKAMGAQKYQVDGDLRTSGPGFGLTVHPDALDLPRRWRSPRVVFVNSMSDLFHARVPIGFVRDVFEVIADTPQHTYQLLTKRSLRLRRFADRLQWPANLWMGVSVENSTELARIEDLRVTPAKVKFLSAEPLLGPLVTETPAMSLDLTGIDWVITGGESGPRARPCDPTWVRDIRDACAETGTAFFHKQWGGRTPKAGGRELDGREHSAMPPRLVSAG